ncbi:DUF4214 domain-containing protein [Pseudomonas sp. Pseusp122]|uniref:DUF4214 domain-containing protein n=1 Tax=unclassified Pseudomonas TaxID=196821 RepID=UPI0039A46D4B
MAASTYLDQVQQLYIAYFGRPADPVGQRFWAQVIDDAGGSIASVLAGFSASNESQALYGASSTAQKVAAIYSNVFNRAPEAAGLAYWVSQIDSGQITQAQAAWTIQQAAGPGDASTVNNKLIAANVFTANIDTTAEIVGYSGSTAAAVARAFLNKVDATYASIANVATDSIAAVAAATGLAIASPTTQAPPATPVFSAIKDGNNVVTFDNIGNEITITESGGVYTVTNNGTYAGSKTFSGTVSGIVVPDTTTLKISSAVAAGLTFTGAGSVVLTDTGSVAATVLSGIDSATTGLVVATGVSLITGTAAQVAAVAGAASTATSGLATSTAYAVTVTGLADVASLNIIDAKTNGVITASVSGTAATLNGLAPASTNNAYSLIVTNDTGATAASVLSLLDSKTTALVDATAITLISGTAAEIAAVANATSTLSSGLNISGTFTANVSDALTGAGGVTSLNLIDNRTSGAVTASLTGTIDQLKALNTNLTADANAYTLTLSDTSAAANDLVTLDQKTSIAINATSVTTLSGTSADVLTAVIATGITKAVGFNSTLSGAFTVSDINSIAASSAAGIITYNAGAAGGTIDFTGVSHAVVINGGSGIDNIIGGSGNDILNGASGDTLFGSAGNDTFNVTAGSVTIADLSSGDNLVVSAGGTAVANNITNFSATAGTVNSGAVTLTAASTGASIDLHLASSANGFSITGGVGNDTLIGSSGNDVITSGGGSDILTGGAGNDKFIITGRTGFVSASSTYASITDLSLSDKISFGVSGMFLLADAVNHSSFADALSSVPTSSSSTMLVIRAVGNDTYAFFMRHLTPASVMLLR